MRGPDYIIDIHGLRPAAKDADREPAPASRRAGGGPQGNPWLAVHWRCCNCYSRIYRNRAATAYEGHCPKCGRKVKATIGDQGTSSRFFEAH